MKADTPWWLEVCAAAGRIRERFGLDKALGYLVGEKLVLFLRLCQDDPKLGADLPEFVRRIKKLFTDHEITTYLKQMPRGRTFSSGPMDKTLIRQALLS